MDNIDREKIMNNSDILFRITIYENLIEKCVDKKILTLEMSEIINNSSIFKREKHKNLLTKITKRGPTAFIQFICSLYELKYYEAVFVMLN